MKDILFWTLFRLALCDLETMMRRNYCEDFGVKLWKLFGQIPIVRYDG